MYANVNLLILSILIRLFVICINYSPDFGKLYNSTLTLLHALPQKTRTVDNRHTKPFGLNLFSTSKNAPRSFIFDNFYLSKSIYWTRSLYQYLTIFIVILIIKFCPNSRFYFFVFNLQNFMVFKTFQVIRRPSCLSVNVYWIRHSKIMRLNFLGIRK